MSLLLKDDGGCVVGEVDVHEDGTFTGVLFTGPQYDDQPISGTLGEPTEILADPLRGSWGCGPFRD